MRTEAELRDYLAEHLHLIEKDLQLRAKEYRLENSLGTTGRVDILASDRFAATVVIELKKTDQSARQALHEVHKYVALLKRERGLSTAQLRCMVVSVEWGELLLPFSEFVRSTPWVVDGYRLILDDQGVPTGSEKVSPVEEPNPSASVVYMTPTFLGTPERETVQFLFWRTYFRNCTLRNT